MSDKNISSVFSQNLNRLLREKGMTQVDLAKRIDAAPSAVNAWVKGATIPRTPTLRKIMEVLGCELDDLMINRYLSDEQVLQIVAQGFSVAPAFDDIKNSFWDLTDNEVPQALKFSVVNDATGAKITCTRDQIISALNANVSFAEFFNRMLRRQDENQDDLTEYLEMLRTRPECRMLFSLTKDAAKEDVEKAVAIITALRSTEGK